MKKMVQGMNRWEVQDAHGAKPEAVKTYRTRVTRLGRADSLCNSMLSHILAAPVTHHLT